LEYTLSTPPLTESHGHADNSRPFGDAFPFLFLSETDIGTDPLWNRLDCRCASLCITCNVNAEPEFLVMSKKFVLLLWLGFHANIIVICGIITGSLFIQFGLGEFPCPLCMTQRISMMLCAVAQAYILCRIQIDGRLHWRDFVMGKGATLFAALAGASMSIRHILLHIVPPDPGYGMAFFGLHTYTWAFFVFVAEIIAVAINLLLAPKSLEDVPLPSGRLTRYVLGFLAVVIFALACATFIEQGFHWTLPDDPVRNELWYDLGLGQP
jgi:disulfide bond formation protein DsbB